MNNHPIQPSIGIVAQCMDMFKSGTRIEDMCRVAAQWGADQELEACCEWLECDWNDNPDCVLEIRAARRPKPPTLKELALEELMDCEMHHTIELNIIRQALEALPNDN